MITDSAYLSVWCSFLHKSKFENDNSDTVSSNCPTYGCPLFPLYGQDAISKVSRSMYLLDHILHRWNIGRIKALPPRSIDSPVPG
jgi:hypothetical protein